MKIVIQAWRVCTGVHHRITVQNATYSAHEVYQRPKKRSATRKRDKKVSIARKGARDHFVNRVHIDISTQARKDRFFRWQQRLISRVKGFHLAASFAGVAASGITAGCALLAELPVDFGAPFVEFLVHVRPSRIARVQELHEFSVRQELCSWPDTQRFLCDMINKVSVS